MGRLARPDLRLDERDVGDLDVDDHVVLASLHLVHLSGLEHFRRPELPYHHRAHDDASLTGANLSDSAFRLKSYRNILLRIKGGWADDVPVPAPAVGARPAGRGPAQRPDGARSGQGRLHRPGRGRAGLGGRRATPGTRWGPRPPGPPADATAAPPTRGSPGAGRGRRRRGRPGPGPPGGPAEPQPLREPLVTPVLSTQEPLAGTQEPSAGTQEPSASTQEPWLARKAHATGLPAGPAVPVIMTA